MKLEKSWSRFWSEKKRKEAKRATLETGRNIFMAPVSRTTALVLEKMGSDIFRSVGGD